MPNRTDLERVTPRGTHEPRDIPGSQGPAGPTGPTGGTVLHGALLKLTGDQTMGGGDQDIAWDAAVYDIDGCYSASHKSRLTVPSGFNYARVLGTMFADSAAAPPGGLYFKFNGDILLPGLGANIISISTTVLIGAFTHWMPVSAGDYFELFVGLTSGTLKADTRTGFSIELAQ